jgi:type IV pilus assembly protein PilE
VFGDGQTVIEPNPPADNRDMHHGQRLMGSQRGFTLIELMIVVATIGVLALIAFPSYMDSVRKSRRADAMAGLMRLQQLQEQYRGTHPTYATALGSLANPAPSESPEHHYTLTVDAADATGYRMSATAKNGSPQYTDTKCRRLEVSMSNGAIGTKSFDINNVEDTTNGNRCWVK